jgi:hypothetical protein
MDNIVSLRLGRYSKGIGSSAHSPYWWFEH